MSLASYRKRVLSQGGNVAEATQYETKRLQIEYILSSPSRSDVHINMDEVNSYPCIVSDIDTFNIRRFLFLPDMKVYMGDYISHDGFLYLAIGQTTDDKFPQLICRLCNFDFPIKSEEIKTIIDHEANGKPIYKTTTIHIIKPCVMTSKIYSIADNSSMPLPEGAMTIYLPFIENEPLPEINQTITVRQAEYKVTDLIYEKVIKFDGAIEKGYLEVRLQRVMNNK